MFIFYCLYCLLPRTVLNRLHATTTYLNYMDLITTSSRVSK